MLRPVSASSGLEAAAGQTITRTTDEANLFIHVFISVLNPPVMCIYKVGMSLVMKLRQAVLYWRRWDACTVVAHKAFKLELSSERRDSLE